MASVAIFVSNTDIRDGVPPVAGFNSLGIRARAIGCHLLTGGIGEKPCQAQTGRYDVENRLDGVMRQSSTSKRIRSIPLLLGAVRRTSESRRRGSFPDCAARKFVGVPRTMVRVSFCEAQVTRQLWSNNVF